MYTLNIINPDIAFDGWAVALIVFLLSATGAGIYLTRSKIKQKQKAGKNAKQKQHVRESSLKENNTVSQKQEAGNNSEQNQIA